MAGSTILGGAMKFIGQAQQDKAEQQKMLMAKFDASQQSIQAARQMVNPNAAWIRRFIVIMLLAFVGFILVAPVAGLKTNVPQEVTDGFKFLFFDFTTTRTEWKTLDGIVTPEWLKFAILDIISFYFGTAAVQRQ